MSSSTEVDFAILTIVPEAWTAVRQLFGLPTRWEARAGQDWAVWDLDTEDAGTQCVVVDDAVDRSDMPAQEAATLILETWAPRHLIVADIGAGFSGRDGIGLGDVIVASNLEYYSLVKETPAGEQPRNFPIAEPSRGLRKDLARLSDRVPGWPELIPVGRPSTVGSVPQVLPGQIVVGERLLANPESATVAYLQDRYPKALGLDMESVGVARAVYAAQQQGIFTQFGVLRGISDLLDAPELDNQQTRDDVKPYAAAAAITAAYAYIRSRPTGAVPAAPAPDPWRLPAARPSHVVDLIAEKTRDFVGREYVFDAIEQFVADTDRGYLIVEGDPGAGKSAILAEYVRRSGAIAHFNSRGHGIVSATQFLDAVASQVSARRGGSAPPAAEAGKEVSERVYALLEAARATQPAGEPLVIVVDALDETDRATGPGGNLLGLPAMPPAGVHIVASTRRGPLPLRVESALVRYDLAEHARATMTDVRAYIDLHARRGRIQTWLTERGIALDEFVDTLAAKSEGNFMYLRHVLPELALGVDAAFDLEQLPLGLENYYESHWRLMEVGDGDGPSLKVWVIYVLCEFRRPVSARVVAEALRHAPVDASPLRVQRVFDEWGQFLHRDATTRPGRFSLYHASFQDFLHRRDIVASVGLTLEAVNGHIADALWEHEFGATAQES